MFDSPNPSMPRLLALRRVPPPRCLPPRAFCRLVPPTGRLPLLLPLDFVALRFVFADLGIVML
jgi:hypothetical protein